MVGCVIVAAGRIIGEGAHRADGQAHAEVEALRRVAASDVALLRGATAYVSLEPCSIAGRTGACTERLVAAGVARVVVSVVDQTPGVCGRGLERLRVGGIDVELGPGQDPGAEITRPRNVYATLNRPFVILKQAVSADGYVGRRGAEVAITGAFAKTLTHQWRSEADAVLVGAGTVLADAPALTVRHTAGRSPAVVVLDLRSGLRATDFASFRSAEVDLQASRKVFWARPTPAVPDDQTEAPTADADRPGPVDLKILALDADRAMASLLQQLHALRIGRVLVEGGPATLRRFVAAGCWDEYRELRSDHDLAPEARCSTASDRDPRRHTGPVFTARWQPPDRTTHLRVRALNST